MRIIITTVQALFMKGGAEFLAANLKNALESHGHEVEIVALPFFDSPPEVIEDYIVSACLFDVKKTWVGDSDLCIALKFPAYFIRHPNKVVWLLHQHRPAYELYGSEYSNIKNDSCGNYIRNIIFNADTKFLSKVKSIYTISKNVSKRLMKNNGLSSEPLYHPCPNMEKFYEGKFKDYILMPSRINITKRQFMAIEAIAECRQSIRLIIVGKSENKHALDKLLSLISQKHLRNRVEYRSFVSEQEKYHLYSNARAILFIPYDEDYGYVTLEGMAAGKPVITAEDSGGTLEFVEDGETGFIVKPNALSIAKAIDEIAQSRHLAAELGCNGKARLKSMNISWDNVIENLVGK